MALEECNGNWNFLYEFRIGDNWYPCNVIEINDNRVRIYTRNGSVMTERYENVRKMGEEQYLKERLDTIKYTGEYAFDRGYHKNIEDDLELLRNSMELSIK